MAEWQMRQAKGKGLKFKQPREKEEGVKKGENSAGGGTGRGERERHGKTAEKQDEEMEENRGEKVKRGLLLSSSTTTAGKRRIGSGPNKTTSTTTTPVHSWQKEEAAGIGAGEVKISKFHRPIFSLPEASARKLAAAVWEFVRHFSPENMYTGVNNHRLHHHHHHRQQDPYGHRLMDTKDVGADQFNLGYPSHSSPEHRHPAGSSGLRRHVATSLMRHHPSAERNDHILQQRSSPGSYNSSLEMTPYNPAVTPSSSIEFKGRVGDSRYSLKSSAELLKVLNRIWTLEEQHASNISLVKALKTELDHARTKIKELLRDREVNRHEMDGLMKQVTQDKLVRKSKEHDRISAAIQSLKDELDDERKLRKRSETLHRKLSRELFEVKVAFSTTLKELEKERKSRRLLEGLCDEFAKGIRDYGRKIHGLKQNPDMDFTSIADLDSLILHISESWVDERLQLQKEGPVIAGTDLADRVPVVEKLRPEIESFIQARQIGCSPAKSSNHKAPVSPLSDTRNHPDENHRRRRSLESIPEAVSAPRYLGTDDSAFYDEVSKDQDESLESRGPEAVECTTEDMTRQSNDLDDKKMMKKMMMMMKMATGGSKKGQSPPSFGMNFEERTARASPGPQSTDARLRAGEVTPTEVTISQKPGQSEATAEDGNYHSRQQEHDELYRSNTNSVDKLRSEFLHQPEAKSTGSNLSQQYESREAPVSKTKLAAAAALKRNISPVRKWMMSLRSPDPHVSEPSSKEQDNSLKMKLQESKSKGQRARLKILKGLS